jgi:excisionase family DNA binding protein
MGGGGRTTLPAIAMANDKGMNGFPQRRHGGDGELVKRTMGLADSLNGKSRALRVSDVATLLNISERQVYKLAAEHRIPCFKIGVSIRFDPMAIAGWLHQAAGSVRQHDQTLIHVTK